jgi:tetraacyldisaccharide 4'-kinase
MRAAWIEARHETALRRAALLPLDALALVYGAGARLHRTAYARGWLRRSELACRVVSVGNLVVGGSGKTPTAAWIARELHRRGHRVAIASRGYGRRGRERVLVVSDGRHARTRAELAGDEPWLLAAHAPGVPVLVGRDRAVVGLRAISAFDTEVLVLDDGFHHHRLARDVEVVVFDGAAGFGNRRVLPRGPLREPAGCLRLADAVGVVDGPLPPEDDALLARLAPAAFRFAARREPTSLRPLAGGPGTPAASLAGRTVGLLAGIARPASLRRSLEALGARVAAERVFPDHHRYRRSDLAGLAREAPLWVTTEKDAIKIPPALVGDAELLVLRIELAVAEPIRLLEWLEVRMR